MFIVLEGLDGAGKSTQIRMLRQLLAERGVESEYVHFPRFDAPVYGEKFMQRFDPAEIEAHEETLLRRATERLEGIGGLRIYGTAPGKCAILSFNVEGVHPYDMGMILDKLGIAVRTGQHCAEPVMDHYGTTGMCRASFALYNTLAEADALAAGVERAVKMLRN